MANRSSTSSSERADRWAGWPRTAATAILALALVLLVDRSIFGLDGPWRTMGDFLPPGKPLERGIVLDRTALRELRDAGEDARSVVILGNSRARAAFRRAQARKVDPQSVHIELSHAGMELVESLAMASMLEPYGVDVTVLVLSEVELHGPLRLKRSAGVGSWRALGDLVSHLDGSTILERRHDLLRAAVSASLRGYRDRRVSHAVLVDPFRTFTPAPVTFRGGPSPGRASEVDGLLAAVGSSRSGEELERLEARAAAALPHVPRRGIRLQVRQLSQVGPSDEHALGSALFVDLVETLRGIGSQVLIVEAPIHPIAGEIYDRAELREEFVRLARSLSERPGVDFLPLEESGPFDDGDFADLTHLARDLDQAAPRFARLIATRARAMIERGMIERQDDEPSRLPDAASGAEERPDPR